ncbi:Kelch repeat-containing protein [Opitutus terrae]|uniref:Metallophosphoesterase n=1 Tax=Opitutus terrae (strain DSM 11246 / JCM 15787 / PB90-1) TaxID=452637 RepID=B1ZX16_OPITP|nr:kelch repeat-containing protein [Opitutus terrae]ACB75127.1 metallophosphoesterase [Opitutus terrae PB90-1]
MRLNDAVNPGGRSWSHSIAPDQNFLIFAGVIDANTPRADSLGDIDLYVSFRVNGRWQPGINLGPAVNTKEAEVWPRISRDGRDLFFNRQGPDARGIYQIKLEPLLAPLRPKTSAGAWNRLPDIPTARLAAGAVACNGELYVIGGCVVRDRAAHPIAAVEVFSPATGTWTTKAPLPTPRSNFGVAVADGRIFVIGGTLADNLSETDVVEAYDPVTDHWTRAASLPTARCQVGAAAVDGKIYAIGGNRHHEHAFEVYDPATDRWSKLPSLEAPRRDAGVVAMDGKIYVAVGLGADARNPLNRFQVYDPATQRWSERTAAQRPRCDSAIVALGSSIVVIGGWNRGPIVSVEEYVPTHDRWAARENLPVATQFHCAAALDYRLYVFTGAHRLPEATNVAWVWSPNSDLRDNADRFWPRFGSPPFHSFFRWVPLGCRCMCRFAGPVGISRAPVPAIVSMNTSSLDLAAALVRSVVWSAPTVQRTFRALGASLSVCGVFGSIPAAHGAVRVYRHEIVCEGLPSNFDGLRIVHLSDVHAASLGHDGARIADELTAAVNAERPDLVVYTGDYGAPVDFARGPDLLGRLQTSLGKFAVLGNHDFGEQERASDNWTSPADKRRKIALLADAFRERGFSLLVNEAAVLSRGSQRLAVLGVGVHDSHHGFADADLPAAAAMAGETPFRMLLAHSPEYWETAVQGRSAIDLTLVGHTHGAQIGLGFGRFVWSPAAWQFRHWGGLYHEGAQWLNVNRGIGYVGVRFRFNMPADVSVLTLRTQRASGASVR